MKLQVPLLLLGFLPLVAAPAEGPNWSKPREMPSLVVRWQRQGEACAMAARDGVVYVFEPGRIVALEAENGRTRWEHAIEIDHCPYHWQTPLLALDEVVVAAAQDRLFVVDRANGTPRHTLSLGARFSTMWGPPVLVEAGEGERRDLLAIDPVAGRVTGRHQFRSGIHDLQTVGQVTLVTSHWPPVIALGLPGLTPLWSASGFSGVGLAAGRVVLGRQVKEGDCVFEDVFPVDPTSGRLGARLFRRTSSDPREKPPWDLEFLERDTGFSLRRVRPRDGEPLWEAGLPGEVTAWGEAGGRLYAHCSRTGRGFLVALDSTTGRLVDAAYGLRDVYRIDSLGDELFLLTGDGVVAASSREFGPPEAATLSVAEAVHRIVSAPIEGWDRDESLRDLEALGPEALPAITEEVPRIAGWPLAVAASRLGSAGYKEAAPMLAERLQSKDASPSRDSVEIALLDALAALGGSGEVTATKAVLEAVGGGEWVKLHAFMTLATIGTPEALESVTRALEARRGRLRNGFRPASVAAFVELIGRPVDEAARSQAAEREDFVEWGRLGRGVGCAKVSLPEGRALVVFPDGRLGNRRDLWAHELGTDGKIASDGVFLGISVPGPPCDEGCPIEASFQDSVLTVRRRGGSGDVVRVDLATPRRDSDGDGLTDFAETRLGTDPQLKDSDGDGIEDSRDPFPRARFHEPATEIEEVTAAVFEQFHLFAEGTDDLAVFVSDLVLPASGRQGPTLIVSPKELEAFKFKSGLDGTSFISIGPSDAGGALVAGHIAAFTRGSAAGVSAPDPRDRRYGLTIYRGPLNAVGYEIVVRRTERGWLVRSLRQAWVS